LNYFKKSLAPAFHSEHFFWMKLSELIEELTALKNTHGDLPVTAQAENDPSSEELLLKAIFSNQVYDSEIPKNRIVLEYKSSAVGMQM
jgi:hypothetical protein